MSNVSEAYSGQMSRVDGRASDWVTPEEIPDPSPIPQPTGWNILIRPVTIQNEIKLKQGGSILLPESFTEDVKYLTNVGQVKAIGPLAYTDPNTKPSDGKWHPHGRYLAPWCKVGDYVTWGKHQGVRLLIKGVAFVLLQDELVLMVLDKPSDINPMMNAFRV